jgi:predicted outer membrane lipoprotein
MVKILRADTRPPEGETMARFTRTALVLAGFLGFVLAVPFGVTNAHAAEKSKDGGAKVEAAAPAPAETPTPESPKRIAIRKLMELSGAGDLGMQFMDQLFPALRQMAPGVPEEFWKGFFAKVNPEMLTEMVVPIYDKYLDLADVEALVTFYESPAGRKMTRVQPLILQDSMAVGQEWGRKIAEDAMKELQEKGFIKM